MCKAVSKVEAAAAVKARGGGEQFNGREGETAFVSVGEYTFCDTQRKARVSTL
jgi:hypothetical protein